MQLKKVKEHKFLNLANLSALGLILGIVAIYLVPELAFADPYTKDGFVNTTKNLQDSFINTILPLMSILGLAWAGILAATGNEGARGKIMIILFGSLMGFFAPYIIGFIKGLAG